MRIVKGRGRNRQVWDLPHGSVVKRASDDEATAYVSNIIALIGVKG